MVYTIQSFQANYYESINVSQGVGNFRCNFPDKQPDVCASDLLLMNYQPKPSTETLTIEFDVIIGLRLGSIGLYSEPNNITIRINSIQMSKRFLEKRFYLIKLALNPL